MEYRLRQSRSTGDATSRALRGAGISGTHSGPAMPAGEEQPFKIANNG